MGKIGVAATKYVIRAKIDAEGVVERPDVIGAVFGQTEGLLGDELELRELQRGGRIGRIEVKVTSKDGKSEGTIEIPTSLNKEDTALIAAALETIERVGPCNAKIIVEKIEDVRSSKRDFVVDRAKTLLGKMEEGLPESQELTDMVTEKARTTEITEYGADKLPCGPNVKTSQEIIIVEGRADVVNLLKYGITNTVGLGGTSVPKTAVELCKQKTVTVFLDGDRGGDLILKELMQLTDIDFVARAPIGREAEELTQKEILKALRNKIPASDAFKTFARRAPKLEKPRVVSRVLKPRPAFKMVIKPEHKTLSKLATSLKGSGKATLLKQSGTNFSEVGKVPKSDLSDVLKNLQDGGAQALIIDWNIDQALVNEASNKGIKYLIGARKPRTLKRKPGMFVIEADFLKRKIEEEAKETKTVETKEVKTK